MTGIKNLSQLSELQVDQKDQMNISAMSKYGPPNIQQPVLYRHSERISYLRRVKPVSVY